MAGAVLQAGRGRGGGGGGGEGGGGAGERGGRAGGGGARAVRTGPGEVSTALMVRARRIGMQVSGGYYLHRHPAKVGPDGEAIPREKGEHCVMVVPCYEEIEFFEARAVEWRD